MKVLLIYPGKAFIYSQSEYLATRGYANYTTPSLALLIIGKMCSEKWDVQYLDERFEEIDFESDADIIGLTAMTPQAVRAYEIADTFRKKGKYVVMGGIHATVMPDEAKQHVDSVFIGEAERTWPQFMIDYGKSQTKDIYRAPIPGIIDLQTVSVLPYYELLDNKFWNTTWWPLQISRGCPHNCNYCLTPVKDGNRIRRKTQDQVIKEIEYIKQIKPNRTKIGFSDDNMCTNKGITKSLLREILARKIEFTWATQTDISIGEDVELLALMRETGCTTAIVGLESLVSESLSSFDPKYQWKRKMLDKYSVLIDKIQSYGIKVSAALIVGFDSDDSSVFDRIADFYISHNIIMPQVAILTPYPGTGIREMMINSDKILRDIPWSYYGGFDVVYKPNKMNASEIVLGVEHIYKRVLSPDQIINRLKYFKTKIGRSTKSKTTGQLSTVE